MLLLSSPGFVHHPLDDSPRSLWTMPEAARGTSSTGVRQGNDEGQEEASQGLILANCAEVKAG